jgi:hypothetical protein
MNLYSVTFKIDRDTLHRLGKRFGHEGTPATSMEIDKFIRYIVEENFKPNEEDEKSPLRIKKRKKRK